LYALDATTGVKLWSYATPGDGSFSSPAVANGVVYYGTANTNDGGKGEIYAMNASTGVKLWSHATGSLLIGNAPAVANGMVYVEAAHKLWAFGLKKDQK
jgi:outer membrane protein assembly factor BamB